MPSGYKTSDVPSKYQPLFDFLAAQGGDEVTLTYKEVAAVIGGSLPESAIVATAWWTTKTYRHVQTWRAMGWQARGSTVSLRVRFTRDVEGE